MNKTCPYLQGAHTGVQVAARGSDVNSVMMEGRPPCYRPARGTQICLRGLTRFTRG